MNKYEHQPTVDLILPQMATTIFNAMPCLNYAICSGYMLYTKLAHFVGLMSYTTTFSFSNNVVSIIVLQDGQWTVGDVLEDVSSTDVYQTLLHKHRHTGRT